MVSTGIKLVSDDNHLAQLVRGTGLPCTTILRDALANLARVGVQQPQVVVVDLRDAPQIPYGLAALKREHPTTAVLLIVAKLDPNLMLEAMRAGVNECLIDPVSAPELEAAIKRLVKDLAKPARGEVFAFIGAKGGVGATTVVVNVATALASAVAESTLLVDLNVACGDAAVFLGEEPRFSVMDALENVQRLDDTFFRSLVVRSKSGLELLGASGRPLTHSFETAQIRALLNFAGQTRRYTLVDVPRSDTAALDALEMATKVVIVANQELATVRNASRMAVSLRQRYGPERLGLVLTRSDRRAEIAHEDVERTVGMPVHHTFPSDYRVALQAMNKGRPVVLDNHSDLSTAFFAYARELAGLPDTQRSEKARAGSVFGRLTPKRA